MNREFWDARYAGPDLTYGAEPNDFLREMAPRIPPGPVLGLGEGQGRNAVILAGLGHPVTALDLSEVGLARAREWAASRDVEISTELTDLLPGLELEVGQDGVREVQEGAFHHGPGAVVQVVARKR